MPTALEELEASISEVLGGDETDDPLADLDKTLASVQQTPTVDTRAFQVPQAPAGALPEADLTFPEPVLEYPEQPLQFVEPTVGPQVPELKLQEMEDRTAWLGRQHALEAGSLEQGLESLREEMTLNPRYHSPQEIETAQMKLKYAEQIFRESY